MYFGPFDDEVCEDLRFDRYSWDVRDVATHELGSPFGHAAKGVVVLNHIIERGRFHDHNGVPLKVL